MAMAVSLLVNIDVDDLGRAEAFYVKAFSLKPTRRFGQGGVELQGAGAPIYLLVKPAGSRALKLGQQTRSYARHWTPVHLDFVVSDIKSVVTQAQAAGATLEGEVETHNWGHIAHMADPFGHGICIVEFRNRGYDEVSTPA
jgi:predicted enzyme related to lactoylglutathione lyase